jgi:hypothetical protein
MTQRWWLRPTVIVALTWAIPLVIAVWALASGHLWVGILFATWCLLGSRRVVPLIRTALADRRR